MKNKKSMALNEKDALEVQRIEQLIRKMESFLSQSGYLNEAYQGGGSDDPKATYVADQVEKLKERLKELTHKDLSDEQAYTEELGEMEDSPYHGESQQRGPSDFTPDHEQAYSGFNNTFNRIARKRIMRQADGPDFLKMREDGGKVMPGQGSAYIFGLLTGKGIDVQDMYEENGNLVIVTVPPKRNINTI